MIQAAPLSSDPARILRSAPMEAFPAAFVSDPCHPAPLNRYSILTAYPLALLTADSPLTPLRLEECDPGRPSRQFDHLHDAVASAMALLGEPGGLPAEFAEQSGGAPFMGGLAGTLAYEFGARFERMPQRPRADALPAFRFGVYPAAYVMDHVENRAWWVQRSGIGTASGMGSRIEHSATLLRAWVESAIDAEAEGGDSTDGANASDERHAPDADWRADWSASMEAPAYREAIRSIHGYLCQGDIYQANLTVRYRRTCSLDPRRLFGRLTKENPAPFAAFLGSPESAILSSSPELLFDLSTGGDLETRPIKGTLAIPPGMPSADLDARCRQTALRLLHSPKDRAEHLMIVDLERNDLGRVCRTGSVHVDPLFSVEKYEGLFHLVSSVRGKLRPGLGPCDVLGSLFPGGSISGAPKIRAMEIIHELEPVPRGSYTGAIGWITPEGGARMNLAIRTLTQHSGYLDLHVGGGIVMDSDADSEFEECRIKGRAMARAVRIEAQQPLESRR